MTAARGTGVLFLTSGGRRRLASADPSCELSPASCRPSIDRRSREANPTPNLNPAPDAACP
eukprot:scaffold2351_cov403-Prasinococcus_capsulatus_cf.AAC.7